MKSELKGMPSKRVYRRHMIQSAGLAAIVIGFSLALGIVGYHLFGGLPWIDALVNASMILGGMGPVDPIRSTGGKWFESAYALYSGVALLTSVGVMFAPALHKFLHRFHLETQEAEEDERRPEEGDAGTARASVTACEVGTRRSRRRRPPARPARGPARAPRHLPRSPPAAGIHG